MLNNVTLKLCWRVPSIHGYGKIRFGKLFRQSRPAKIAVDNCGSNGSTNTPDIYRENFGIEHQVSECGGLGNPDGIPDGNPGKGIFRIVAPVRTFRRDRSQIAVVDTGLVFFDSD